MKPLLDYLANDPEPKIYKSRTMMASWLVSGYAAHFGFNHSATGVIFMAPDEDRAVHDVQCVKHLWENSSDALKAKWPLSKALSKQAYNRFDMANGTWFLGIPGDPNKIRSAHPTIIIFDECAFFERGEEAYNIAIATRCPKFICLSSAEMGWFEDLFAQTVVADWPDYEEQAA